ncbi:MAG: ATP-binding protein [Desulfobacterales bacterium]|nr:ATP-binding protein [Desulfobacterales bacterium]MCP4159083.1 ATP-binding protein [Deltaproteobacteria bacterium]
MLKKELEELMTFMKDEGEQLGLSQVNLDKIKVDKIETLKFTFPSHTSQLELIRLVSSRVISTLPAFDEDDLDDIGLAMDEACTNIIVHSYHENISGVIIVKFTLEPDKVTITIIDKGEKGQTFNPDELSIVDKEAYLSTLSRGGLGVHIIKKIMDEVEYTVVPGLHNCLTMVKYGKISVKK